MSSKYLNSLTKESYLTLCKKLLATQDGKCYICLNEIDMDIHTYNVDHIVPLASRGKDNEDNFALTHETCNKQKLDSNLNIARILNRLTEIQDRVHQTLNKAASLKDILEFYEGSKFEFTYTTENHTLSYSFDKLGQTSIKEAMIFSDQLSGEESVFLNVPIEYLFHDQEINPRGINNSIGKLIKEFDKGNPQLHLTLARMADNKIKVFDGQHKAVAQILLGVKTIPVRLFIKPDIDRLIETNTNAGSTLRQIAFDKSILRQLNNSLYLDRINKYQLDHTLTEDDLSFSESELINYFKGESIRKLIIDTVKNSVTHSNDNKLKDYIDFEGKQKDLPISYSAFDKTFLSIFIDSKQFFSTPISYRNDEGLNPRELQIEQIVDLLNIIAEEIYIGKFKTEVGVTQIEKKIIDKKDLDISDDHLIAYRLSREEILYNWILFIKEVINNYFSNLGKMVNENEYFQNKFDPQLWANIRNFLVNLKEMPIWKDRTRTSLFSGKNNYDFWKTVFKTGQSPDKVDILLKPINFVEMIKNKQL